MGSSSKKHRKDSKKHKRSRSDSESSDVRVEKDRDPSKRRHRHNRSRKNEDEPRSRSGSLIPKSSSKSNEDRRHKHKHKKHKHGKDSRRKEDVIVSLDNSDSDSSDCVEVPVEAEDGNAVKSQKKPSEVPRNDVELQLEREKRAREKDQRDREKELREREKREREREREREKDRERDFREREHKEREMAREREQAQYREREPRDRERERDREQYRDRERDRDQYMDRERDRDQDRDRERNRDQYSDRERERDRDQDRYQHQHQNESQQQKPSSSSSFRREPERRKERSPSPIPENGAGDCLSIEETNKIRLKLGLKPLEVDSGPIRPSTASAEKSSNEENKSGAQLASYKDEWGEFLHKPADNLKDKAQAEKLREKFKQKKEKRMLDDKLKRVKTLGESDDEGDDVEKWVNRNKNKEVMRKEADMRAKALEEMDAEFGVDELMEKDKQDSRRRAYNDKHLRGLRVDHDMEDFSEGKTVILTLKDKDVLDEEDDALVNVNMMDDEHYRKNVANKKKNPLSYGYDVYEEQYDMLGNPIDRGILGKYDEEIEGAQRKKNFVIGDNIQERKEQQRKLLEIKTKLAGKRLETLEDTRIQLASDTYTEVELAQFKKPKKKVKKVRQKLKADDLLPLGRNESGEKHFGRRGRIHADPDDDDDVEMVLDQSEMKHNIEEEDDLQKVLSKARKLKQKESLIKKTLSLDTTELKPEVVKDEPEDEDEQANGLKEAHITLNATAEFCRTLGDIPTYGMAGNRDEDSNDMMDYEVEERINEVKQEEPEASTGTWNSVNPEDVIRPMEDDISNDFGDVAILDEEPDVGAGVGNALKLALSKGYLEKDDKNRPSNSKLSYLQAKNYSIEDKSAGDDDKFGRRDRFHSGPIMEFRDKETFKPNVKLEYIDDNGRILNLKEAFRYLSHKFHGKGPGKNKIEKRLKKMEQDGLMKTMSSTDTPLGTLTMLQQKQKETKTPYVVLSGGKQAAAVSNTTISKYK